MNILIPMAGDLHQDELGYSKLFYEIDGKVLLQHILETIYNQFKTEKIIIVTGHKENENVEKIIKLISNEVTVVKALGKTSGPACTTLLAIDYISDDEGLVIINGDQIINANLNQVIKKFKSDNADGGLVTFESFHPRWSFVRTDDKDNVVETAEKTPISNQASAGVYYFKSSQDFLKSVQSMILKNASYNNNFYIAPVYNEMILNNKKIISHRIEREDYLKLSTNEDILQFRNYIKNEGIK